MKLQVKRLTETATLPTKAHPTDSGFDLYADEDAIIKPQGTVVIKTGIAIKLPEGYEAEVRPRSGITSKTKLRVQQGTIDNAYRGEIGIIVDNISVTSGFQLNHEDIPNETLVSTVNKDLKVANGEHDMNAILIQKGDKIAQLVVNKIPMFSEVEEVEELGETDRGDKGFGSSGYSSFDKDALVKKINEVLLDNEMKPTEELVELFNRSNLGLVVYDSSEMSVDEVCKQEEAKEVIHSQWIKGNWNYLLYKR